MTTSNGAQNTKPATVGCCPVVELRQYTLHPGKRDALVELFERELIESQEALGISVIGQFRDMDDPERFVWLRGFQDMEARGPALAAFYGGPVWEAHRKAANATMLDSDNALLLRPVGPEGGFALGERGAIDAPGRPQHPGRGRGHDPLPRRRGNGRLCGFLQGGDGTQARRCGWFGPGGAGNGKQREHLSTVARP